MRYLGIAPASPVLVETLNFVSSARPFVFLEKMSLPWEVPGLKLPYIGFLHHYSSTFAGAAPLPVAKPSTDRALLLPTDSSLFTMLFTWIFLSRSGIPKEMEFVSGLCQSVYVPFIPGLQTQQLNTWMKLKDVLHNNMCWYSQMVSSTVTFFSFYSNYKRLLQWQF